MHRLVSWPMYALDDRAVARLWTQLRQALADVGFSGLPTALTAPDHLAAHWEDPAVLLSQTCGFPFVTNLRGRVRYVATPRFAVPGCEGAFYSSAVVVRRDEDAGTLRGMAGRRVAFNARDSQSGYNGLRALVAPLAAHGHFFGNAVETGSHRASIRAVTSGAADLAAIDVVTLTLLGDHAPHETEGLRILCHTEMMPGLPLITASNTSDADIARLRRAAAKAFRGDSPAAQALRLDGIAVLPEESYDRLLTQRDDAVASGYPELA